MKGIFFILDALATPAQSRQFVFRKKKTKTKKNSIFTLSHLQKMEIVPNNEANISKKFMVTPQDSIDWWDEKSQGKKST